MSAIARKGPDALLRLLRGAAVSDGEYQHWDDFRRRPAQSDFSPEEAWAGLKFARVSAAQKLPLTQARGAPFQFCEPPFVREALRAIDSRASGAIGASGRAITSDTQEIYLQRSLIEEPFMSSVLEGAATTRAAARQMVEDERPPRSLGERMVLNNYRAMAFIRQRAREKLTPALILEIHRIVTLDTLENPQKAGVLRGEDDKVRVEDGEGEILHMPPAAPELSARLEALCAFANGKADAGSYVHPVIRAIILHFMLAYEHPFVDGNGRTARGLFYWSALSSGYWLLEYVSISAVIKRAPVKYGRAFLLTETDDGDLTYFIAHQLDVVCAAIDSLHDYLNKKDAEFKAFDRALNEGAHGLNTRQLSLLQEAVRRSSSRFLIAEYQHRHRVSYLTARSDLEELTRRGFLRKKKEGATSVYTAIRKRLQPVTSL